MTDLAAALAAVLDTQADQSPQQRAEQAVTALLDAVGPGTAARIEALALQQRAIGKLREADRQEHHARLTAAVDEAEQQHQDAAAEAEALAETARVTLVVLRHCEDQHQGAADHAQECQDAAENAALIGDEPRIQTELILARNAAKEVLDGFAAALTRAELHHRHAAADADAARERIRPAKLLEQAARDALAAAEQHPERTPRSAITLLAGLSDAIADPGSLTDPERATVRGLVSLISSAIGADGPALARGREQALGEARDVIRQATSTMPARSGVIVPPPR